MAEQNQLYQFQEGRATAYQIDDSDNEKEDEKKEAEAVVDLSMGANLVSPTTTKKKKLNKGAAVF